MVIDGRTRTCGLIGNPVEHTMSPAIHNFLAEKTGVNLAYLPFHVEDGNLEKAVAGAWGLNFLGLNVTVPYKSDVIPYLEEVDELAARIGAVNTLVRTDKGFKGYNTDMPGLYRAMISDGISVTGEKVLILGAGGVARAVAVMLAEKKAGEIRILNRTLSKAEEIAKEVNAMFGRELVIPMELGKWAELPQGEVYGVIQATKVGMFPKTEEAVIEEEAFYKKVKWGYDLVYNPMETKFMRLVKGAGAEAFNGFKMLLYQGIIAFELWTGKEICEELAAEVYASVLRETGTGKGESALERKKNLLLIGFMGAGKTTVGLKLSWKLRLPVEDTDKLIEKKAGMTISDIFREQGEVAFRDMETALLREISQRPYQRIFSVGGGTPVREENRELLKQCGTVVYLRLKPETVWNRLKGDDSRPLLRCEDPLGKIRELMEARRVAYEGCADVILDVDDLSVQECADKIAEILEEKA